MAVQAASVASVTPQGEVAQVRQVVVRYDRAVVPLGDPHQADPMALACPGTPAAGSGRWASGNTWLYNLHAAQPSTAPGLVAGVVVQQAALAGAREPSRGELCHFFVLLCPEGA